MTNSTTKIKTAGNGGTSTDPGAQQTSAVPVSGFARLRESEVYHLMSLASSALRETEQVVRTIENKARDRYFDHEDATQPLDSDEIGRLLSDAYQCAIKATTVIDEAATHWLNEGDLPDEPITLR